MDSAWIVHDNAWKKMRFSNCILRFAGNAFSAAITVYL